MQRPDSRSATNTNPPTELGILARMALALTDWTERWVPDAFVFALLATVIVIVAGVAFTPSRLPQVIDAWGKGCWELIPFTLQMALIIITGHVLATSQPVGRVIRRVAAWPTTPRNAVALVAFFAMASSWFNWGFSLIFSAVLAKEIARRLEGVDYRALAAASFLGLGSVWAPGLSGSAALQIGARSRHRSRKIGDRTAGASRETDSGPMARTFADPQLADCSHRRHVSGPVLYAGRRTAKRDQPQHRQLHLFAPRFPSAQN